LKGVLWLDPSFVLIVERFILGFSCFLILQRQIIKNPTPTLTLPLKGRGFYGVF
jgi:hypothetical protein